MKKLMIALLVCFGLSANAQHTSWFVENQAYTHNNKDGRKLNYSFLYSSFSHQLKCGLGVWNYSLIGYERWGGVAGLNYAFNPSKESRLEIGSGLGRIGDYRGVRASSYFLFQTKQGGYISERYQAEVYASVEYLGKKEWITFYAKYNVYTHMSLGVMAQSDGSIGPRIEFMRDAIHLWAAAGYQLDARDMGTHFGVSYRLY